MNISAAIIDQRLIGICNEIRDRARDELGIDDEGRLTSLAFVYLCVKTILNMTDDEAFECLTEGGGDFGIDALHISEEHEGNFIVRLFQGKYKRNLEADANFPEKGILNLIKALEYLFDPSLPLKHTNPSLTVKVEEVRSLIQDGYFPQVRVFACNNGLKWNEAGEEHIKRKIPVFGRQVSWEHVNHDHLLNILQSTKKVDDIIELVGSAIIEDIGVVRVLIGRIDITGIAGLIDKHGDRLLERNVRRYLGLGGNRVNKAIRDTIVNAQECGKFYFYNNGITLICDRFSYNALQSSNYKVQVENLQIINGGQTCMTIRETLKNLTYEQQPYGAYVLIRLYQLPNDSDNEDLVSKITLATNTQNPVELRDLRANDKTQRRLETDIAQLEFSYRRKRVDAQAKSTEITSSVAAEAILSVWRQKPHQAKFFTREHFGKLYSTIFTDDLTGAQVIIATLIYRYAENKRKRPPEDAPLFVRYASCFIAMQMGKYLLQDLGGSLQDLTHKTFDDSRRLVERNVQQYFERAVDAVDKALKKLYADPQLSAQQLSATFRRGDLIERLNQVDRDNNPVTDGPKPRRRKGR
ncbi:abortive infection phage resistance protein [Candidatus Magnetobacterium bavaricum]|uniref:Abortive infection phage resistance protein n=1 Tax=Candidatus Magnetobacterium bavaricum TaxID=29290 RepID=A0A0F3GR90_9BACT|nr:abortive infection phage resistance protein [Candidatus Magnetobacterium bavaricum]